MTAEELVSGIGTATVEPERRLGRAAALVQPARRSRSTTPLLYQPPTSLTGGMAQIWAGASPQPIGASTQWGGCNVYASLDGTTYAEVATITQPVEQGRALGLSPDRHRRRRHRPTRSRSTCR